MSNWTIRQSLDLYLDLRGKARVEHQFAQCCKKILDLLPGTSGSA